MATSKKNQDEKEMPVRFEFESVYQHNPGTYAVIVHKGRRHQEIGVVSVRLTKWYIDHIGSRHDYSVDAGPLKYRQLFDSKENAAQVLYLLWQTLEANPLPDDLRHYIIDQMNGLERERTAAISTFFELQAKIRDFAVMASKYGLKYDHNADMQKEVERLKKFMDEYNDAMYEKLGKDFARSLRGYVANVVRLVDPLAANEI